MFAVILTDKSSHHTTVLSTHDTPTMAEPLAALARHIAADHSNGWTVRWPLAGLLDRDVLRVRLVDYIDPKNGGLMAETDAVAAAIIDFPACGR